MQRRNHRLAGALIMGPEAARNVEANNRTIKILEEFKSKNKVQ